MEPAAQIGSEAQIQNDPDPFRYLGDGRKALAAPHRLDAATPPGDLKRRPTTAQPCARLLRPTASVSRHREAPPLPTVKDGIGAATAARAGGRGQGWWVAARVEGEVGASGAA